MADEATQFDTLLIGGVVIDGTGAGAVRADLAITANRIAAIGDLTSASARRMLDAIDGLPDGEREVLDLVRIHGMTHAETAELLGVSIKTVQRRLQHALLLLAAELKDLGPGRQNDDEP